MVKHGFSLRAFISKPLDPVSHYFSAECFPYFASARSLSAKELTILHKVKSAKYYKFLYSQSLL